MDVFQSTPPARGATAGVTGQMVTMIISIHAPREGGDAACCCGTCPRNRFQSTPPARGATPWTTICTCWTEFQSTPPARGATRETFAAYAELCIISIHAPREGGDAPDAREEAEKAIFQSTPPARGATT